MLEQQTQHTLDRIEFHLQSLERKAFYLPSTTFNLPFSISRVAAEVNRAVRLNDQPVLAEFARFGGRLSMIGGAMEELAKPTGDFVEAIGRRANKQVQGDLFGQAIDTVDKLLQEKVSDQFFDKFAELYIYGEPKMFNEAVSHLLGVSIRDRDSIGPLCSAIQLFSSVNYPGSERFYSDYDFFSATPYYTEYYPSERTMLDPNSRTLDMPDGTIYYSSRSGVPLSARGNLDLLNDLLGGKYFRDDDFSRDSVYPRNPNWYFIVGIKPTLFISYQRGLRQDKIKDEGSPEIVMYCETSQNKKDVPSLQGITEVVKATAGGRGVLRFQKEGQSFSQDSGQIIGILDIDPVNRQVIS